MVQTAVTKQVSLPASSLLFPEFDFGVADIDTYPSEEFQRVIVRIAFGNELANTVVNVYQLVRGDELTVDSMIIREVTRDPAIQQARVCRRRWGDRNVLPKSHGVSGEDILTDVLCTSVLLLMGRVSVQSVGIGESPAQCRADDRK